MSKHVADVTQYDFDDLLDLKNKCVLEMQAAHGSSYPSKECPIFTYSISNEIRDDYIKLVETNIKHLLVYDVHVDDSSTYLTYRHIRKTGS